MSEELKACPFCGAHKQPEGIGLRWEEEPDDLFYVACERCGGRTMGGDTEAEAITAWNQRTDPDHIAAIRLARAALEGSLEALDAAVENVQGIWDDEHAEASNDLRAFMLREIDIAKARAGVARGTITHLDTLLQTKGDDRGEG